MRGFLEPHFDSVFSRPFTPHLVSPSLAFSLTPSFLLPNTACSVAYAGMETCPHLSEEIAFSAHQSLLALSSARFLRGDDKVLNLVDSYTAS